jgi:uncharacterized cupredoxin-like copper-binding protein
MAATGHDRPPRYRRRAGFAAITGAAATAVAATACGADTGAEPTRESTLVLEAFENGDEYGYRAVGDVDLRAGDRVTIEMRNGGALIHDLVVIHPDGSTAATAPSIAAGATTTLTFDAVDAGVYRLNCNVDDHLTQHGMQEFVEVRNADGTSNVS